MSGLAYLYDLQSRYPKADTRSVQAMKLVWVQEDERRKAQREELPDDQLPHLWILVATISQPLLEEAEGKTKADWLPGVYFMASILKTAIVVIDQLPETEETLWLRILGRDETQERAIREVLALPTSHPRRNSILRLLASWKVRIDLGEIQDFSGQEAIMALSEAFLAWEQQTQERIRQEVRQELKQEVRQEARQEERQEERQAIARRLLQQGLPIEAIAQATELSIPEVQTLQQQG